MTKEEKIKKKTQFKGVVLLLITAFIWGISFVSQSVGIELIEGFTFSGIRTLLGAIVLLPFIIVRDRNNKKKMNGIEWEENKRLNKKTLCYGIILGIVFCAASNFQQFAFNYSSSGKIAFITTIYMFFVPLFGLFFKKRVPWMTLICVIIEFAGLYFLCIDQRNLGVINKGDILAFICAILFAIHILMIERYAPDVDGTKLSCIQFFVSGVISCILMFIFETPKISAIKNAAIPLLYSGVLSCGLAYTLQIIGQKYTEATVASLLMSMESVFAVLAAAIILHEILSGREVVGCVIMFIAIILSQLTGIIGSEKTKL